MIWVAILLMALLMAGCQDRTARTGAQPDEGGASDNSPQPADTVSGQPEEPEEPACTHECGQVTAFCRDGSFYACVQEGDCREIIHIADCSPGYECENTIMCSKDGDQKKEGVMILDQLLNAAPVEGKAGEEFTLNLNQEKMRCSIMRIIDDHVIVECE